MIKFHCAHCDKKIGAKDEYAGRRIQCPRCKTAVRVPRPPAGSKEDISPLAAALIAEEAAKVQAQPAEIDEGSHAAPLEAQPQPGVRHAMFDSPSPPRPGKFKDLTRGRYSRTGPVGDGRLLRVAWCQKVLIYCFVAYICIFLAFVFGPVAWARPLKLIDPLVTLAAIVCVCALAFMLQGGGRGLIYAILALILMWIPLVNLILLYVVNKKAIRMLNDHRVPVGFLGVSFGWLIGAGR